MYVNVNVVGLSFNVSTEYNKPVFDVATMIEGRAITWDTVVLGRHGGDPNYVLSTLAQDTDLFIDEYLCVNADACD